jgi:CubicO group peptidase (beta-lactamase class C family)
MRITRREFAASSSAAAIALGVTDARAETRLEFPGKTWTRAEPLAVGLDEARLNALRDLVGGRGCVVRRGFLVYGWGELSQATDVASAVKPLISTLLFIAIQEGKLKSVDDRVSEFEPALAKLNGGKDAAITWRHLASQTSGYGLAEQPGAAYSYNDFALALYFDVLTQRVFREPIDDILKSRIAEPLGFEDRCTFRAINRPDRAGRLAASVRDMARFGYMYQWSGQWSRAPIITREHHKLAISSPIAADTPLTAGKDAEMLPDQRSLGGSKNITPAGPGYYSFNWWLNRLDKHGRRLYRDLPEDAYFAVGHGGKRAVWIVPSLSLVVSWNDAVLDDHDDSPGDANTKCNRAAKLLREAVV